MADGALACPAGGRRLDAALAKKVFSSVRRIRASEECGDARRSRRTCSVFSAVLAILIGVLNEQRQSSPNCRARGVRGAPCARPSSRPATFTPPLENSSNGVATAFQSAHPSQEPRSCGGHRRLSCRRTSHGGKARTPSPSQQWHRLARDADGQHRGGATTLGKCLHAGGRLPRLATWWQTQHQTEIVQHRRLHATSTASAGDGRIGRSGILSARATLRARPASSRRAGARHGRRRQRHVEAIVDEDACGCPDRGETARVRAGSASRSLMSRLRGPARDRRLSSGRPRRRR